VAVRFDGDTRPGERQIVFGAHLLLHCPSVELPPDAIVYNTEQLTADSIWLPDDYVTLLRKYSVWDYSQRNIERLRRLGVSRASFVRLGYVPELKRIKPRSQDIDVLFYGSINDRRGLVLDGLKAFGVNVVHLFGAYGAARDEMIARAKILLNMHYYASKIFEIVRVSYLLTNGKAVVAECGPETEVEPDIRQAVWGVGYDSLITACRHLLGNEQARHALAARGQEIFSARREEEILARALAIT
jgi:hypothetical protein